MKLFSYELNNKQITEEKKMVQKYGEVSKIAYEKSLIK